MFVRVVSTLPGSSAAMLYTSGSTSRGRTRMIVSVVISNVTRAPDPKFEREKNGVFANIVLLHTWLQEVTFHFVSTSHHIPRTARCFHDVPFFVKLSQQLTCIELHSVESLQTDSVDQQARSANYVLRLMKNR